MRIGPVLPTITYTPQQIRQPAASPAANPTTNPAATPASTTSPDAGFGHQVLDAIDHVNNIQHSADSLVEQVSSGKTEDAHKAMIAMEHALLTLDFTLQVRNKVLDAYQEVMRTQI